MPDEPLPTLAEVRGIMLKPTHNRTAHTIMVTCRVPYEMDRRLTALAKREGCTKTALMLAAVEQMLRENEVPGGEDE